MSTFVEPNNVIKFPKQNVRFDQQPLTLEEVEENIDNVKSMHIQESLALIVRILFEQLTIAGFDTFDADNIEHVKDGALIVESIRAMMNRNYDLSHPLHDVANSLFAEDDNGVLYMKDMVESDNT
jgi:hypothetical protein